MTYCVSRGAGIGGEESRLREIAEIESVSVSENVERVVVFVLEY